MKLIDKETLLFAMLDDMAINSNRTKEFNDIFTSSNINASYIPLNIRNDDIFFTLNGLKKSQIKGVNIGLVYEKESVELLDNMSDEARECNFINSITIKDEKLYGYLTIGKAIASMLSGNIAIFGSNDLTKSILWNLKDTSFVTVVESEIEKTLAISKKYSKIDIVFSDETHYFDSLKYDFIFNSTSEDIFIKNQPKSLKIISINNSEDLQRIQTIQNSIDIQHWI